MANRPTPARFVTTAMTMDFELLVDDDSIDPAVIAATIGSIGDELRSIEATFSTFQPDSWVSRLNRGEVELAACPSEVAEVLALCNHYAAVTGGAFDATSPDGGVDPTGIVKTWAMRRVLPHVEAVGARRWLWGCSGDAMVGGVEEVGEREGDRWTVGIADPRVPRAAARVVDRVALDSTRPAVATSGTTEHGAHIWGPGGAAASSLLSATVVGADLVECDAWATALVAGGLDTANLAAQADLEFLLTSERDGELVAVRSPGWRYR